MNSIRNTRADVLVLPSYGSLDNGNIIGDAHTVLDDGRVVPMANVSVGDRPYYVLRGGDAGTAILCDVVSTLVHDVHRNGATFERLRVEFAPIIDAPTVEVVP